MKLFVGRVVEKVSGSIVVYAIPDGFILLVGGIDGFKCFISDVFDSAIDCLSVDIFELYIIF